MFEEYVKGCIPSNTIKTVSGSQCDEMLKAARKNGTNTNGIVPPDYYIRVPEGCVLFEYKDALTNAKVKESRDAEKLFADIKKKFFENNKGSHKGVTQLLDCAMAIQNGKFFFDNPKANSIIYPVLVVENPVYSMRGMHTLLEYMIREECLSRGMRSVSIKPLIMVDVASLKLYSDYLNKRGLIQSFEDYYNHINPKGTIAQKDPVESLISFTDYLKDKDITDMHSVINKLIIEARSVLNHYE